VVHGLVAQTCRLWRKSSYPQVRGFFFCDFAFLKLLKLLRAFRTAVSHGIRGLQRLLREEFMVIKGQIYGD